MGSTFFAIEDTPAFESNVDVLRTETDWVRRQCCNLGQAVRVYGESLDPRLRRRADLGLPGAVANLTAPLLEALARNDQGAGSPTDNGDTRFADLLETLVSPESENVEEAELAGPLSVGHPAYSSETQPSPPFTTHVSFSRSTSRGYELRGRPYDRARLITKQPAA
ncbi:hypothetical protein CYMTET_18342, partial [Cymbomonas tetramitiformis]